MNTILKGNICYSRSPQELATVENGYLVCEGRTIRGVFPAIPDAYRDFPVTDHGDCLVIPGLCDLHVHAPQFVFRGLGLDAQLLEWLNKYAFPEEARYLDIEYADKAYSLFVDALIRGATTRACVYATLHAPATELLMEKLEASGLVTFVGKVNMDRNCPEYLREPGAGEAYRTTRSWLERTRGKYENTYPIITPRFYPACSDELMVKLKELQTEFGLPVQSHLSENRDEAIWVHELCPGARSYGDAYNRFGLFGGDGTPTIMAHCVLSEGAEETLLKDNGVYVAHCPQSNANLSSGIAPVRRFLRNGIRVGLGSDVAAGCHASIFRAMSDAVQVSKLYWRLVDQRDAPLTIPEAFYLGTAGGGEFFGGEPSGGEFFGKVGRFEEGYEFDAVVIDDSGSASPDKLTIEERLARVVYFADDCCIVEKYVRGKKLKPPAQGGRP